MCTHHVVNLEKAAALVDVLHEGRRCVQTPPPHGQKILVEPGQLHVAAVKEKRLQPTYTLQQLMQGSQTKGWCDLQGRWMNTGKEFSS